MSLQQALFNKCYEYIVNHNGTPYIYVTTQLMVDQSLIPYADSNNKITLNISMNAVEHFEVNSDGINLSLKFQGRPVQTQIPFMAIISIYDKANVTTGMLFNSGFLWTAVPPPPITPPTVTPIRKKPTLTIVK